MDNSPLKKLQALSRDKETAFLALFAGANRYIKIYKHRDGEIRAPNWGKAECEWIDDWEDFWFRELVDLGFMAPEKLRTFPCLGMGDGTEWTGEEWDMAVTDEGFDAREAWWADWRAKVDALDAKLSASNG